MFCIYKNIFSGKIQSILLMKKKERKKNENKCIVVIKYLNSVCKCYFISIISWNMQEKGFFPTFPPKAITLRVLRLRQKFEKYSFGISFFPSKIWILGITPLQVIKHVNYASSDPMKNLASTVGSLLSSYSQRRGSSLRHGLIARLSTKSYCHG